MKAGQSQKRVFISIVNYRTAARTIECLRSLNAERKLNPGLRVYVGDGHSQDGSYDHINEWIRSNSHNEWVTLLELPINGGFGWAQNQLISRMLTAEPAPDYVIIQNPDTLVPVGSVQAMLAFMETHPDAGAAGPRIFNLKGEVQVSAFNFPGVAHELADGTGIAGLPRLMWRPDLGVPPSDAQRAVGWVSGSFAIFRSKALMEAGLFDDGFFLYFEEVELMLRIQRKGWQVWYNPEVSIRHEGGASTNVSRDVAVRNEVGRPLYWYQSRKRFQVLDKGIVVATALFAAWLLCRLTIFQMRCIASKEFRQATVHRDLRNSLAAWTREFGFDLKRAARTWDDRSDKFPLWWSRPSMQRFARGE